MTTAQDKMRLVKAASVGLANATSQQRADALHNIARLLIERTPEIMAANAKDIERGQANDMTVSTQMNSPRREAHSCNFRIGYQDHHAS